MDLAAYLKGNRLVIALFLLTIAATANAKTIYVDIDRPTGGSGASWSNAHKYLQDALADANSSAKPVEVRMAQGTYKPDEGSSFTSGDREATFYLINGVTLKGGFAGDGETNPNERNIANNQTILSGDLDGNDVPIDNAVDLLDEPTRNENSYHVVTCSNLDATAVLDGFTITAGNASDSAQEAVGGGMFINAKYGGTPGPTLVNCIFRGNSAAETGGGLSTSGYGSTTMLNCTFSKNLACDAGGGIYLEFNKARLISCTFNGNMSICEGGGMFFMTEEGLNVKLTNCTFTGNQTSGDGGGFITSHGWPKFYNCTFSSNSAGGDGGGFCCTFFEGNPQFNNCILWSNTAANGSQFAMKATGFTLSIDYCDVEGGESGVYVESGTLDWGIGNITSNPLLVDADGPDNIIGTVDDDLHLLEGSPCIDAGNNSAVPADVNEDLDGNPRFVDDPEKTDTGSGTVPIVDMGAYEARRYIYVDTDAPGDNDGTSWTNAYNRLQDGLSAATGGWGEILIAEGIYKPDQGDDITSGDRSASFQLKSGIDLRGGYAGFGEFNPDTRNTHTYKTILSGDLNGNDIPISDPCELENEPSRAENSFHVVTGADNTTIDGFTIAGGNADGGGTDYYGAGLYNAASSPTVVNCTFSGNWASSGGGIYNDSASAGDTTGCLFICNASNNGGGIYNSSDSTELTNCTFSNNLANYDGGGIYSYQTCPVMKNCILWCNTDSGGMDESAQIYPYLYFGTANVNYNCIQGLTGGLGGTGNVDSDPCFANTSNGDYHLKSEAGRWKYSIYFKLDPTRDSFIDLFDFAAFANYWQKQGNFLPADLDNSGLVDWVDFRLLLDNYLADYPCGKWVFDDVNSPCIDAGDFASNWTAELWPHGKRINMGAYGGTSQASMSSSDAGNAADLNNNDLVDYADLMLLANRCFCCEVLLCEDLNRSGAVDFIDFAIFADNWHWKQ